MCRTEKKRKAKKNMIQQKSMIFHSFHWPPEYIGCLPDMIFDHDDSSSLGSSSYMNLPKTRQLTIPLCINIIIIIDVWLYLWHQCYIYIYALCYHYCDLRLSLLLFYMYICVILFVIHFLSPSRWVFVIYTYEQENTHALTLHILYFIVYIMYERASVAFAHHQCKNDRDKKKYTLYYIMYVYHFHHKSRITSQQNKYNQQKKNDQEISFCCCCIFFSS